MLQKKVCMLGAFGVGKTSLIRRYVESIFSDTYLTTVGVKLNKKVVTVGTDAVTLLLWDLAGEDETVPIRMSYLRGAAGYLLVADGTRRNTLEVAQSIHARVAAELGPIPHLLLLNKVDLVDDWELPASPGEVCSDAAAVVRTSAKTGEGVEEAFRALTERIIR